MPSGRSSLAIRSRGECPHFGTGTPPSGSSTSCCATCQMAIRGATLTLLTSGGQGDLKHGWISESREEARNDGASLHSRSPARSSLAGIPTETPSRQRLSLAGLAGGLEPHIRLRTSRVYDLTSGSAPGQWPGLLPDR